MKYMILLRYIPVVVTAFLLHRFVVSVLIVYHYLLTYFGARIASLKQVLTTPTLQQL